MPISTTRPEVWTAHTLDDVLQLLEKREAERAAFDFPVDGIVLRIMHDDYFRALGATAHHPHGSIAFKFAPAKAVTTCRRIEVTVGKTGKRTPVAYFDSVTLLDREVHSASLYSEKTASDLGIYPGATIEVGLSNDITPKVYRVIASAGAPVSSVGDGSAVAPSQPLSANPLSSASDEAPADCLVCGDTIATDDEEEEAWLAPSLFSDEAPAPAASDEEAAPATALGGSPTEEPATPHHSTTAAVLATVACAAVLCCFGAVVLGAAVFCLPLIAGTLRV